MIGADINLPVDALALTSGIGARALPDTRQGPEDGVRDLAKRPVTFLYNGGPGASSNWLTMSGLGPYKVDLVNGAATPPAPYSVKPSHESILNDSDLVFVDAMGTGFSHIGGKGNGKMFWGVDQDVKAFGQFIQRYITQNDRWNSPLFLYGESYGTTRSAALAYYLQDKGIAVNGVILQSSILFGSFSRKQRLPDVALDIAAAMRKNPYLRVLSENGYFDLATPFHATEYDLDHVTLSPKLRKHIEFAYFDSGHPIYINPNALKAMHTTLDAFYADTLNADAAAYGAAH